MALTQISTEGIKNGTITGSDLATNVDLVDNQKLRLGTGNDFEIFFNGTNTSLYTNTGDITIQTAGDDIQLLANDDIQLLVAGGVETAVNCIGHGAVELYFDNSLKFETIASGTRTTGAVHVNDGSASGNRLSVGNGGDLKIYHTNPNSYIDDDSSALSISSQRIDLVSDDGENMARFYKDAQVELYHDNEKKLNTTAGGVLVTGDFATTGSGGTITANEHLKIPNDTGKLLLGASNDLQIYHDGSHSYIYDTGTGKLRLVTNSFRLLETDNSTNMIAADENGAVELYYDGSKKFETTSAGATVTGNLVFGDNGELRFGDGTDLRIYHYNSNNWINTVNGTLEFARGGTAKFGMDANGDLSIYDGVKALFGNSNDLQIYHSGSDSFIAETGTGQLKISGSAGVHIMKHDWQEVMASFYHDSGVELYFNNVKKFHTQSAGVYVTGDLQLTGDVYMLDNERLRIGTGQDLEIKHDGTNSYLTTKTGALIIRNTINNAIHLGTNNTDRWYVYDAGHFIPSANNTYDIGSSSYRVRNIYTNDLNLSNEGSSNDVDGTWGSILYRKEQRIFS